MVPAHGRVGSTPGGITGEHAFDSSYALDTEALPSQSKSAELSSSPAARGRNFLTVLELGLAKARSDCVNGDGASSLSAGPLNAVPPGVGETFDSRPASPASPSYSPEPSPEPSDDEMEHNDRAIGLASVAEVRLLEIFPTSMPSFEAILHWTETFLLGEYAYKDVTHHAIEQVVRHFVQLRRNMGPTVPQENENGASSSSSQSE